jgi:DNA-binding transcriptional MerR regulator
VLLKNTMSDQTKTDADSEDHTYDISTVCRLTGLTSANLRIWEKRYQAVSPSRSSSGRRQYSRGDLQRLTLLKTLTDLGHTISSSAKLPMVELERRVEESARPEPFGSVKISGEAGRLPHACRICVVGGYISTLLSNSEIISDKAKVVGEFPDLGAAELGEVESGVDLLIVECPALFVEEIVRINHLIAKSKSIRAIVVYSNTQDEVLDELDRLSAKITAIKSPVSARELEALCRADIVLANRSASASLASAGLPPEAKDGIPDRKFSDVQLASISQISSTIKCECPHQLVGLLAGLNGFEAYSAECENRNVADAEIHGYLHKSTAQARAIIEEALEVLLDFEGMDVVD